MRAKRKPLTLNVWFNSSDKGAEPMPPWLKKVAESAAKPGTTFLISPSTDRFLVHVGHYVIQGAAGSVYPCTPANFAAHYDIINVAAADKVEQKAQEPKGIP